MKNLFIFIFLSVSVFIFSLNDKFYIAVQGNLNVREIPGTSGKIVTQVKENHLLILTGQPQNKETVNNLENYWYKIRTLDGIEGYVFGAYIKPVEIVNKMPALYPDINIEFSLIGGQDRIEEREKFLFKKYNKNYRKESSLFMVLKNGEYKELKDKNDPNKEVECEFYKLLHYYENINYYLIYVSCYEWSEIILVNGNNGKEYYLADIPVFSKNYNRFVCSTVSDERRAGNICLEIYSINANGIELLHKYLQTANDNMLFFLSNPKWINDNLVSFERVNIKNWEEDQYFTTKAHAEYAEGKWVLYK